MNKIELLSTMAKVNQALETNDYGKLALALGMSKAMVEEMSLDEIFGAMTVRMADLNRALELALGKTVLKQQRRISE